MPTPDLIDDELNLCVAYYLQTVPKEFIFDAVRLVTYRIFHVYQFGRLKMWRIMGIYYLIKSLDRYV